MNFFLDCDVFRWATDVLETQRAQFADSLDKEIADLGLLVPLLLLPALLVTVWR